MPEVATYYNPGTEEQKRAVLEAMSRAGTEGRKAFDAAQAELAQTKQAAISRMLADQHSGAPVDTSRVNTTNDRFAQALATSRANFEQDIARRQGSNESYLNQVSQAAPLLKARADTTYGQARSDLEGEIGRRKSDLEHALAVQKQRFEEEKAAEARKLAIAEAERAEDRAFAREKMAHQRAQWQAEASGGLGGGDLSDSELKTRLSGLADEAIRAGIPGTENPAAGGPLDYTGNVLNPGRTTSRASLSSVARQIGAGAGLEPGRVSGLFAEDAAAPSPRFLDGRDDVLYGDATPAIDLKNIAKWANTDEKTARSISTNREYLDKRNAAIDWLSAPVTPDGTAEGDPYHRTPWEIFLDELAPLIDGEGPRKDRTYRALIGEFEPVFRSTRRI